jgi:hypothetical protein
MPTGRSNVDGKEMETRLREVQFTAARKECDGPG